SASPRRGESCERPIDNRPQAASLPYIGRSPWGTHERETGRGIAMRPSLIALAALCASSILNAQVAGAISGYVRDATGASVPGARITAVLVGQQLTRTTVADGTGFYNLLAMPPGVYDVTAES